MLTTANIPFFKTETEGLLQIPFEIDDETITLYAYEKVLFRNAKIETRLIKFYTKVLSIPKYFKFSVDFLTTLSKLNAELDVGRLSISNVDSDIYYYSSLYFDTANGDTLVKEFYIASLTKNKARKVLIPFIDEQR